jgi:hypothetical protein
MFNVDGTIGQAAHQQRGSSEQLACRNPIDIADVVAAVVVAPASTIARLMPMPERVSSKRS